MAERCEGLGARLTRLTRRLARLGVRRESREKQTPEEARARDRPKPRAAQNGTFGKGAVVPGFGSDDDDDTARRGSLSLWGAYRGQPWAVPPT